MCNVTKHPKVSATTQSLEKEIQICFHRNTASYRGNKSTVVKKQIQDNVFGTNTNGTALKTNHSLPDPPSDRSYRTCSEKTRMKNPLKKKSSAKKEDEVPAAAKLDAQQSTYKDEHTMPLEKLAEQLDTNFEMGLVDAEAKMRLERDGPNSLTPPKKTPEWLK